MTPREKLTPSGSQTVGPFFSIGLQYLIDLQEANASPANTIEFRGKVIDRDGAPVPDAMLEFWSASAAGGRVRVEADSRGFPAGFCRTATDANGAYSARVTRPGPVPAAHGRTQAPHFLVLVFARGLLRHLITRVYFEAAPANNEDPVLLQVPAERRHTLIAGVDQRDANIFHWNVVLQGNDETAFFAW